MEILRLKQNGSVHTEPEVSNNLKYLREVFKSLTPSQNRRCLQLRPWVLASHGVFSWTQWRLRFEETDPSVHTEAVQVQHTQKIVSRVTRLAKCTQEGEQVYSTGMPILGHEHQLQQN